MRDPDFTLATARTDSNESPSLPLKRSSLLAYAASAPVATTAVGLLGTPSKAEALALPLTPPDSVDVYDVGDSLVQLGAERVKVMLPLSVIPRNTRGLKG